MSTKLTEEQRVSKLLHSDEREPWDIDTWGISETLVAEDVSNGEYEGCTSELEMHFQHYESLAKEIIQKMGWGVNYCPGCSSLIRRRRAQFKDPKCLMCGIKIKILRKEIEGVPGAWEWVKAE